jgi:hypothetical protein
MLGIDPLLAAGVVVATAATDAVYVMFTSAVVRPPPCAHRHLEQHLVRAVLVRGHLIY